MNSKKQAFTLVELIVVITILAILGTIAFISLQGYSTQARDSTRISDLSSIKTSLELFQIEAGKYPLPTNGVDITYSGGIVWNQGTFGETVFSNVKELDKLPVDPLTSKEYTYSVTGKKNEFQLGGIVEGDIIGLKQNNFILPFTANAGETIAIAYITGNYNGGMVKSNSGTLCNILAIPSIITNDTNITDLQQISTNKSFVYRGYKNLPSSFKQSKFKFDGGFQFESNNLLAYSDNNNCEPLIDKTSYTARLNLLKGLQDSYSGTLLQSEGEIKNIVNLVIDTNTPSNELIKYSGHFVNNELGGNVNTSNNTIKNVPVNVPISPTGNTYTISSCPIVNLLQNATTPTKTEIINNINNYIGCSASGISGIIAGYTYSGSILPENKMILVTETTDTALMSTTGWGSFGTDIVGLDNISTVIDSNNSIYGWDGLLDTNAIISSQGIGVTSAAQKCNVKGMYLPSIEELNQLYCYSDQANIGDLHYGNTVTYGANCVSKGYLSYNIGTLTNFDAAGIYWTSSENNSFYSWTQYFSNGARYDVHMRIQSFAVRCVNRF